MPNIKEILSSMPKEQEHRFESAGEFVKRLANRVTKWREMLPDDLEPVILSFLPSGDFVEVVSIIHRSLPPGEEPDWLSP